MLMSSFYSTITFLYRSSKGWIAGGEKMSKLQFALYLVVEIRWNRKNLLFVNTLRSSSVRNAPCLVYCYGIDNPEKGMGFRKRYADPTFISASR